MSFWRRLMRRLRRKKEVATGKDFSALYMKPVDVQRIVTRKRHATDLAQQFYDEKLVLDPNSSIKRGELEEVWKAWKASHLSLIPEKVGITTGCRHLMIGLKILFPDQISSFVKQSKYKTKLYYKGIRFK